MIDKKDNRNQKNITTIHMSRDIHQWLKLHAVKTGKTVSSILEELAIKLKNQTERNKKE